MPRLEIYFKDSRSLLVVFLDKEIRRTMHQKLSRLIVDLGPESNPTPGYMKTPLFKSVSAKMLPTFKGHELSSAQRKWQAREISNVRSCVTISPCRSHSYTRITSSRI